MFYIAGDRLSKSSAKFYPDESHHLHGNSETGSTSENPTYHCQQPGTYQPHYQQYYQSPSTVNQVHAPLRPSRLPQTIPGIAINNSTIQQQNSAHSTSGSNDLVEQFEVVNI